MTLGVLKNVLFFKKIKKNAFTVSFFCLMTIASIGQQTKHGGDNHIPGIIESENFDLGGEGVAYHDKESGQVAQVSNYRRSSDPDVEIEAKPKRSNGHSIGYTNDGEWLEYTFNTKNKGSYTVSLMATARNIGSKGFQLFIDGKKISEKIEVNPNVDWFNEWKKYAVDVKIKKGKHVLRVEIFSDGQYAINMDFIEFVYKKDPLSSQLSVTNLLSDNAILQRNENVNIWGKGKPGNIVTIEPEWGIPVTTLINKKGEWKTSVNTKEGGPYKLTIKDETNTLVFKDILFGEVWVCAGQSNMDLPMKGWGPSGMLNNAEKEMANANYPNIRLFKVDRAASFEPESTLGGLWRICTPNQAEYYSSVAYFFARKLHKELNVPIGIIQITKGSSKAEAWTSSGYMKKIKEFENVERDLERSKTKNKPYNIDYIGDDTKSFETPAALYNGMVTPVTPYTVKGIVWYQGESNADNPALYNDIFPKLIESWREGFNRSDLPFYYVQICPFQNYDQKKQNSHELREAQFFAKEVPNTGMAVTLDLGDRWKIHPGNKQDVGKRLALWALAKQYGKNIVFSGPIYRSSEFKNGEGYIKFDHVGDGLKIKKGTDNFEIAGIDGVFHKADVAINNDILEVSSNKVSNPIQVRYGWSNWLVPTLFNMNNLPASSFTTYNAFVFSEDYFIDQGPRTIKVPIGEEISVTKFLEKISTVKGASFKVIDRSGKVPSGKMLDDYQVISTMNNGQDTKYYSVILGTSDLGTSQTSIRNTTPTRAVATIRTVIATQEVLDSANEVIKNMESVSIEAQNNGLFVSSENGFKPITCSRKSVDIWERFTIQSIGGGKVTIKGNNELYISSENGLKPMKCNRKSAGAWEEFTLESLGGNVYAIKGNNGLYVSHNKGSVTGLTCDKSVVGDHEKFILSDLTSE